MKSSSSSLVFASLISITSLVGCSPDTGGEATTTNPGAGGGGGATTAAATGGDGDGDASTGSPTVSSGGDGDGGSTSSDGGSTSSDGGAGAGGDPTGGGGDPTGGGGDPSGAGGDAVSSAATGSADVDGDGYTLDEGDCDDNRDDINPGATEICNTRDDNCDGATDEAFDVDGDLWFTCLGDCDDGNPNVNPDQTEIGPNGLDDDCDGDTDGPVTDNDGDGWTENEGDCNDEDENVSPDSIEFPENDIDDDCDGDTDEVLESCDTGLSSGVAADYARAIGLCNGELVGASFISGTAASRAIRTSFGSFNGPMNVPTEGASLVHISSGTADTSTKSVGAAFDGSPGGGCTSSAHPNRLPDPGACGGADPANVCDKSEISLQIRVPQNAQSFTYEFQFFTSEYPRWRCTEFDDTFLAMLSSQAVNGGTSTNISFDTLDKVVSVNNGFLQICNDSAGYSGCDQAPIPVLTGTGYYPFNSVGDGSGGAAATVPLTTTSPVVPGETITLRFIIFDEGDDILDSSVLIDNFRWSLNPSDGPGTEPTN